MLKAQASNWPPLKFDLRRMALLFLALASIAATPVEDDLRTLLADEKADARRIIALATQRESAKLQAIDPDAMRWLAEQEKLHPLFLLALTPEDDPRRALSILTAVNRDFGAKLMGYEDLAVALAVVWDSPAFENQTEAQCQATAASLFAHLTGRKLRLDPRNLPWPVLVYLVNSKATDDDRAWATTTYRLANNPGKAYFDVEYDQTGFRTGRWKGGHDVPYTLANLKRLGGVCKDQAHFAAETMRANGIPATVCTGQAARAGGFHAWVGHLAPSGKSYEWDFRTARYPEHGYWAGSVIHPQTGRKLSDRDVAMSAEWCNSPPEERLFSLAVTRSLDLADDARRIKWAMRAVDAAPGNDEAWFAVVAECAKPATDGKTLNQVMDVVDQFAAGRYDDFAFRILTRLAAARPLDEQLNILDRARNMFQRRPDLKAELQLHQADALRKAGKTNEAMAIYARLLEQAGAFGSIALETLERMEQVLVPAKEERRLAEAYRSAWQRIRPPEASGYAHTTPWYLIGDRYAELLEAMHDLDTADRVRERLDRKDTAVK